MTKEEFNYLIKSPKTRIQKTNLDTIKDLKKQFPYCEIIYNLSLLKSDIIADINFTEILAICAIHSSSRKNLFKLMNPHINLTPKKTKNASYLFEEWLKDSALRGQKIQQTKLIEENVKSSVQDNHYLTTETLAKIYVEQGHDEREDQHTAGWAK